MNYVFIPSGFCYISEGQTRVYNHLRWSSSVMKHFDTLFIFPQYGVVFYITYCNNSCWNLSSDRYFWWFIYYFILLFYHPKDSTYKIIFYEADARILSKVLVYFCQCLIVFHKFPNNKSANGIWSLCQMQVMLRVFQL